MSTSIIIISAILAACLVLPIYLFNKNGSNNSSKMSKLLQLETKNHNLNLSQKEEWGNSFIGIDTSENTILFIKRLVNANEVTVVSLKDVKRCNVKKDVKTVKTKGGAKSTLERLALEFIYISNNAPNVSLEFYNADGDYSEDFEMKRAEKWVDIINTQLAIQVKSPKVA